MTPTDRQFVPVRVIFERPKTEIRVVVSENGQIYALTEDDMIRRATDAWLRSGATEQPADTSDVVMHKGPHVRLKNTDGCVLAVYHVQAGSGHMTRVDPTALDT